MRYFRDREHGFPHPSEDTISSSVWGGGCSIILRLLDSNYFAETFPVMCPDGNFVYDTNIDLFYSEMQAYIPGLKCPITTDDVPPTSIIAEIVEFCFDNIACPKSAGFHKYFGHEHLNFDVETGQSFFRERINTLFTRNAVAFTLDEDGRIIRISAPIIGERLAEFTFDTGDQLLDDLLDTARTKHM